MERQQVPSGTLEQGELGSTSALSKQIKGTHYLDMRIQPIEFIQANGLGFCEGNAVKYVSRWRQKGGIDDLLKAIHYLEILIENERNNNNK